MPLDQKISPEGDLELVQFLNGWFKNGRPMAPPQDGGLHFIEGIGTNLVLFRRGQYQVQLCFMQPNTVLPPHSHPNVHFFIVYLSGEIWFTCGSKSAPDNMVKGTRKDGLSAMFEYRLYIGADVEHKAHTTEMGGSFLSIQKWVNGVKPTCVTRDWSGDQISKGHGADILNHNPA